ncbi:hypothetical protein HPB47_015160 [Ixodes persulcatus]|uniref:Uncharacterized protein n=1 Tax=Ixodes persulcatus TaxID=34615 RepID=A0AC60QU70_IXOPE|nr:hypothetical protein HPB47_015160 [Ixodes persulcatus]
MCKDIEARFVDLSRDLRSEDAMEKDGLHYQNEGLRMVTDRLGAIARRFLGVRWKKASSKIKRYPNQWSSTAEKQNADTPGSGYGRPCATSPVMEPRRVHQETRGMQVPHANDVRICQHYQRNFPRLDPVHDPNRRTRQYQDYLMTDLRSQGNHHHQELPATPVMGGYTTYPYSHILPTPVNQMQPPSQTPTPQYPDMPHPWLPKDDGSQIMMGQRFQHSD